MGKHYKTMSMKDDTPITLQFLDQGDLELSLRFFKALPRNERLYLRRDMAERSEIEKRLAEVEAGQSIVLLALKNGEVIGDILLYINPEEWFSRTGEFRVMVARKYRNKGLARMLIKEIIALARERKLHKIEAQAMTSQKGAIAMLKKLGFVKEGVLKKFAVDLKNKKHDLMLLGYFLEQA